MDPTAHLSKNEVEIENFFEENFSSFSSTLKTCYVALSSLSVKDEKFRLLNKSSIDSNELSPMHTTTVPQLIVFRIWEELLNLHKLDDLNMFSFRNLLRRRTSWKGLIIDEESDNLLKYVESIYRDEFVSFALSKENKYSSMLKERTLYFIQESLEKAGIIELIYESIDIGGGIDHSDSQDRFSSIKFNTYSCLEFKEHFFETENDEKYMEDIALDQLAITSSQELFRKKIDVNSKNYLLCKLPYFLIYSKKFEEAFELLNSSSLFDLRINFNNFRIASSWQLRDALYLHLKVSKVRTYSIQEIERMRKMVLLIFFNLKTQIDKYKGRENSLEIGKTLFVCGLNLEKMEWEEEARDFYQAALTYQSSKNGYHYEASQTLQCLGKYYVRHNMFDFGVKCYTKALAIDKDTLGSHHIQVAKTCELLAVTLVIAEEYEEALMSFEELLIVKKKLYGIDSLEVALVQKELGFLNFTLERYGRALLCYTSAQKITQEKAPSNEKLLASIKFWIGNIYSKMGNYKSAINNFDAALKSRSKSQNDIAYIFEAKGDAFLQSGKLNSSISCYKRASLVQGNGSANDTRMLAKLASAECLTRSSKMA